MTGIRVAGKQLSLNSRVFDGEHGAVLDSGTTYAYLPDAAFSAFEEAVMREASPLKQIDGPDPNFKDTCFRVASRYFRLLILFFLQIYFNQVKLLIVRFGYLASVTMSRGFRKYFQRSRWCLKVDSLGSCLLKIICFE